MGFANSPFGQRSELEPAKFISMPLGATSPLWLAFMGAAGAGVAYWWMTRWARPFNIEAIPALAEPMVPVPEAAMIETIEAATTALEEIIVETIATSEPTIVEAAAVDVIEPAPVIAQTAAVESVAEPFVAEPPDVAQAPAPKPNRTAPKVAVKTAPDSVSDSPAPSVPALVLEVAPVTEPAPDQAIETAKPKPTATPARVSARTKRRQPDTTPPRGPAKRR